ncbi:hypothetical protein [Fodinibius sp.]|uniref:hypothetical protein n=1 Tax=Fodinibius sp. TaxID=1872440 RepID=UPI002ACE9CAB|nr:hypothetical protein [Fodinibius sp.]MDZ7658002.1 hypothetical protein [Fodinibius sp.]
MTNNVPYVSSTIMDKVHKIAAKKYPVNYEDVGLILLQHDKKTYRKRGREVASDMLDFLIFDNSLNKIGVVKRKEVKNYYPDKRHKKTAS